MMEKYVMTSQVHRRERGSVISDCFVRMVGQYSHCGRGQRGGACIGRVLQIGTKR